MPEYSEQIKISKFLSLLDKNIELWERKLQLYLLKKKCIYNKIFKNRNENIKLKDIFSETKEKIDHKNIILASVGKNGIRLKSEVFENVKVKDNHIVKIAKKNYLIIGMGSKQIDSHINLFFDKIGVSVAYKTFKIKNQSYNAKYLDMYLNHFNNYFSSLFMIVSARQGKTVNIYDWFNLKITIHDEVNRNKIAIFGYEFDFLLKEIELKINLLKKEKQYYLNKLFV